MTQASTVAESDVRAAVGVMLERLRSGASDVEIRATLAAVLYAFDPRLPGTARVVSPGRVIAPEAFYDVLGSLYRSLGVSEGQAIPNALRAQVLQCLGFQEPPAPAWLVPGYRFHDPQRWPVGEDVTVSRITSEGVVLRREDGREEEPVPMGLFVARYPTPPPRLDGNVVPFVEGGAAPPILPPRRGELRLGENVIASGIVSAKLSWKQVYDNLQRISESRTTYRCPACGLREERCADEPDPRCVRCAAPLAALGQTFTTDLVDVTAGALPGPPLPKNWVRERSGARRCHEAPMSSPRDTHEELCKYECPSCNRAIVIGYTLNCCYCTAPLVPSKMSERLIARARGEELKRWAEHFGVPVLSTDPDHFIRENIAARTASLREQYQAKAIRPAQPKPAPHQVWDVIGRRPLRVVADVRVKDGVERVFWVDGGDTRTDVLQRRAAITVDAKCIGIELSHGKRMLVGETWEYVSPVDGRYVRHELRSVSVADDGRAIFLTRIASLRFDSVSDVPADRWRKVEEPGAGSPVLSTRATLNSFLYAAHAYRLADRIPFPEGGVAPPTPTPAPRCFDWSRPPLPTAAGLAALGAFFDVVATVAQLPTAEGRAALRNFFAGVAVVLGSSPFLRDVYHRKIDAALAGASPAERAAVLAACERHTPMVGRIPEFLAALRRYEAGRARGMTPERARLEVDDFDVAAPDTWSRVGIDVYERHR